MGGMTLEEFRAEIAACKAAVKAGRLAEQQAEPSAADADADQQLTWDDIVGQRLVRERLEVTIASAIARGKRAEHILLLGPPGRGKTTIAKTVAAQMDRRLVILTKPPTAGKFLWACEQAADGVLFIDEVHCWSKGTQQPWLMELTESGTVETSFATHHFPNLTAIAATTDPDKLLLPLMDRFGCQVTLDSYTTEEMVDIAAGMARRCWPDGREPLDDDTLRVLAEAAAGVPRILRSLVFAGRDLVHAGQVPSAMAILRLCDTDPDGLTRAHLDMLDRLASSNGGTAGLTTLATMLRMPAEVLRRTEQLLIDEGYVALLPTGRQITARGRRRLAAGSIRDRARSDA